MEETTRRRNVTVFVGETESGKTTAMMEVIDSYEHGMVTILDPNNEKDLAAKYSEITMDKVPLQKTGTYRVVSRDFKTFAKACLQNYNEHSEKEGLVCMDDLTSFVPQQKDEDLTELMVSVRHSRLDMILVFHQLWRVPPYILDNAQQLVLFKTGESTDKKDLARFPHSHRVLDAFKRVAGNVNRHHYEVVPLTGQYD